MPLSTAVRTWSRDATIKKYLGCVVAGVDVDDFAEFRLDSARVVFVLALDCETGEDLFLAMVACGDGRRLLRRVRDDIVCRCCI